MRLKRAIGISVLLYIATFILGIIVAVAVGTDLTGGEPITATHWIISMILSIALAALFSLWYFRGKVERTPREGLRLGLTFLAVGIIFDALFIIPYILFGGGVNGAVAYYKDPLFYVSVILIVLTPVVVGMKKK